MSNPFFKNHGPILISEILKFLNIKVDGITWNQVDEGRAKDLMSKVNEIRKK